MARSQPKLPTQPLMIRGDRLLLALRVMRHCAYLQRGDGVSIRAIRRTLRRTFNYTVWESKLKEYFPTNGGLYCLIRDNPELATMDLDISNFVVGAHEGIRSFFERIASGELTEADFREEVR
ncbi:MAG: hypothetical protein Q8R16_05360, partial [bacterium]|nr:hypothetical protein [bacterium]